MTLEEAKDILECSDKDYFIETLYETYHYSNVKKFEKAIDTVLKALDNSISKDEVRKKIEQLEFLRDDAIEDNFLGDARNLKERIDVLQELLGEE